MEGGRSNFGHSIKMSQQFRSKGNKNWGGETEALFGGWLKEGESGENLLSPSLKAMGEIVPL